MQKGYPMRNVMIMMQNLFRLNKDAATMPSHGENGGGGEIGCLCWWPAGTLSKSNGATRPWPPSPSHPPVSTTTTTTAPSSSTNAAVRRVCETMGPSSTVGLLGTYGGRYSTTFWSSRSSGGMNESSKARDLDCRGRRLAAQRFQAVAEMYRKSIQTRITVSGTSWYKRRLVEFVGGVWLSGLGSDEGKVVVNGDTVRLDVAVKLVGRIPVASAGCIVEIAIERNSDTNAVNATVLVPIASRDIAG
ncbi:hypothetical protein BC830DRAFT_904842 [Chytriomyces sp. MP71]|nr:hypothetical protein BC830DRAFT_904842 [Chytriomyces sp. MP71]